MFIRTYHRIHHRHRPPALVEQAAFLLAFSDRADMSSSTSAMAVCILGRTYACRYKAGAQPAGTHLREA